MPASAGDWKNARTLYYNADHNRRLLRRLLRHSCAYPGRPFEHPRNAEFLDQLATTGADTEEWLRPVRRQYGGLELYIETDPLKIFHMGNLFGTCLSVTDFNAHATIVNAAEANKHVIYARNDKGHIVGRKLVVVDRQGTIFGFYTYGSNLASHPARDRPWIMLAFEEFCLDLARRSKLRLAPNQAPYEVEELSLFGEWYDDGTWDFLEWIRQLDGTSAQDDIARVQAYCQGPVTRDILYALLWLGDDAIPAISALHCPTEADIDFLRRHARSDRLRSHLGQGNTSL